MTGRRHRIPTIEGLESRQLLSPFSQVTLADGKKLAVSEGTKA